MMTISPFEYENLVRELYYRDLRQLQGLDRDQAALQTLLAYRHSQHSFKTFIRQSIALWKLLWG